MQFRLRADGHSCWLVLAVRERVVFNPGTPAVAVAETDQLDSASFATPGGVEHNGDGVRKASLVVTR